VAGFSSGYGDIHAKTIAEMIITIFWMIVGVGFYSFTIGLLASVLAHIDYKAQKLQKKKAIMNEFCKEKKISLALKDKLKSALEYNF
jgi:hyperpolarization activated cyclic nucleotide-gated potassium channel 1